MCLSRLVAGAGLSPDEVRSYPAFELGENSQGLNSEDSADRDWRLADLESLDLVGRLVDLESLNLDDRPADLESIDPIKLAPIYLLLAAQEKADELIAQAQTAALEIREEARCQGEAEGREAGKSDLLPSLTAFADAGQSLIAFEERVISEYAQSLVELALEIAGKIIGRAVDADRQIVASVLERAKTETCNAKQLRIWLHPDDLKVLEESRPELLKAEGSNGRTIAVVASLEIGRGGCRLETESGMVDATIPTQLDEMRRQLLGDEIAAGRTGEIPS